MPLIGPSEQRFLRCVAALNYTNPFSAERIAWEEKALGPDFVAEEHPFWSLTSDVGNSTRANVIQLTDRTEQLMQGMRERLQQGKGATDQELQLYDDLAIYLLFYRFLPEWSRAGGDPSGSTRRSVVWRHFSAEFDRWFQIDGVKLPSASQKAHCYALLYQVYRAFFHIFDGVVGQSVPAARLRSQIWQSIFTHDMRRYRRSLYRILPQITTLVTGPSGSGKELVARAIGLSRYIPFDPQAEQFAVRAVDTYVALNISAFSVNLIESELFGHAKGAFTGATAARAGWLELGGEYSTILLDEIGELDATTQVKLLRVLQNRQYQRLGDNTLHEFHGKIIAATNRDMREEIARGRFREDLYYRLCSDVICTPALSEQLSDNPSVLPNLVSFIVRRIAPEEHAELTQEVVQWIDRHLPTNYSWPGNIRELEQCVRNILIHNCYQPSSPAEHDGRTATPAKETTAEELVDLIDGLSISADELVTRYCRIAYARTASYERAAKLLQLDRRTVRARCAGQ